MDRQEAMDRATGLAERVRSCTTGANVHRSGNVLLELAMVVETPEADEETVLSVLADAEAFLEKWSWCAPK